MIKTPVDPLSQRERVGMREIPVDHHSPLNLTFSPRRRDELH